MFGNQVSQLPECLLILSYLTTMKSLAYAELYLTLAATFRYFDLELYETDETDVKLAHDFFLPFPKLDSNGIRVIVKA